MKLYWELFITFFKLGAFTFGGGYAMIPLIEKAIVDERGWLERDEMLDVLAVAQTIPGAIAVNTSTMTGFKVAGRRGSLMATFGLVLPSFMIILLVATVFRQIADSMGVTMAFSGINAAVILLLFMAAKKILQNAIKNPLTIVLCVATIVVTVFSDISPIWMILLGGAVGALSYGIKRRHQQGGRL